MCLVGESGCGKTTTGRLLTRAPPSERAAASSTKERTSGARRAPTSRASAAPCSSCTRTRTASLNPTRTVFQTLSAPLFRHKKANSARQALAAVTELLHACRPHADGELPREVSASALGRSAAARGDRARAHRRSASVIVADEAVSMVDVSIRISLLNLLLALAKEFGVTIVLITHDLAVARYFASRGRIGVMYLGRVVELGTRSRSSPIRRTRTPRRSSRRSRKRIRTSRARSSASSCAAPRSRACCRYRPAAPSTRAARSSEAGLCDVKVPELLPIPGEREVACHVAVRERTGGRAPRVRPDGSRRFFGAHFAVAISILALSLLILPFQDRSSAEFVVTVLAAVVGFCSSGS